MNTDFNSVKVKPQRRGTKSCIPDFTEEEIRRQKEEGAKLAEKITEAANDLSKSSYTIAPGNYGFDFDKRYPFPHCNTDVAFCLNNIERPDDNPFTIKADGVNFFVQPTGKPFGYTSLAFLLYNCANLRFEGLTIDEYVPNDMEGEVTEIDKENNRIAIKISNSSLPIKTPADAQKVANGRSCRIIPFKADGEFISALYKIDPNGWGPGDFWVENIVPADRENEYWLCFRTDLLIRTITSEEWEETYGERGNLKIGDVITVVFGNINILLCNSKKIQMVRLTSHLSKSMPVEKGGYGAHLWKDCFFGPKEGTSKCLNGHEGMFCNTRFGPTYDNCTLLASSDDHFNIHAMWSEIVTVEGNRSTMKNVPIGSLPGDPVKIYDGDGNLLFETTLAEVPDGNNVVLTDAIPDSFVGKWTRFPDMECDNWVIKNCNLLSNYQRVLLQCGNGTFVNNKVYNLGETFAVVNEFGDHYVEGGLLKDVTFKDNVIYNSANCPGARVFKFAQNKQWDGKLMAGKMDVSDNLFVNCGMLAEGNNIDCISFKNNTVIEPVTYNNDIKKVSDLYGDMVYVNKLESENNELYSSKCTEGMQNSDKTHKIDPELTEKIKYYLDNTDKEACEIIKIVRNEL